MIIAISKQQTHGKVQFTLTELESGYVRNWTPSKVLTEDEQKAHLTSIAKQMENEIGDRVIEFPSIPVITNPNAPAVAQVSLSPNMKFADYCNYFIWDKSAYIAENTRDCWQRCITNRINPQLGHIKVCNLQPFHIEMFYRNLYTEGLKYSTIIKYHNLLGSICKRLMNYKFLPSDFWNRIERPQPPKDEAVDTLPAAHTASETKYILACAEKESLKWQTYINLLVDTGVRRGECCGFQWQDIDFRNLEIRICRSVGYTKEKGIFVTTTKSRKVRSVDISKQTANLLLEMYANRNNNTWVFSNRSNKEMPMHPTSPTAYFRKFSKKYGIDKMNPHKLRHTFASIAITNGADVESVSEILGHADSSVTLRHYTTADKESLRRANDVRRQAIENAPDLKAK